MPARKQPHSPVVLSAEVERRLREVGTRSALRGFGITSELTGVPAHDRLIREGYAIGLAQKTNADRQGAT